MVLLEAIEEKNEKEQEAANGNSNGRAGGGQLNNLRQRNGGKGQTTTFVNQHTEPEE